jgi:hypothetical protein
VWSVSKTVGSAEWASRAWDPSLFQSRTNTVPKYKLVSRLVQSHRQKKKTVGEGGRDDLEPGNNGWTEPKE